MRDKRVLLLYISSSSSKKRLTHAYRLTLMPFYIKIMMGNYKTCALITPNSFFFKVVITGHHFWRYSAALPKTDFTFQMFNTCLSLLAKSVLNWVVLILIEQNMILKMQNQDFPPSKIEYVITLLKWLMRLILLLFLVVHRSTFKVVLTIFRILICRSHFSMSRFYPIILTVPFLPHHFNSPMTTKICRISLLRTFFLFLWINLFCSIADLA